MEELSEHISVYFSVECDESLFHFFVWHFTHFRRCLCLVTHWGGGVLLLWAEIFRFTFSRSDEVQNFTVDVGHQITAALEEWSQLKCRGRLNKHISEQLRHSNVFSPTHTHGGIFPRGRAGSALHCSPVAADLLFSQAHIIHSPPPRRERGLEHRQVNEMLTQVV